MRRVLFLLSLLLGLLLGSCGTAPRDPAGRTLVVVSIDAFRWDFLDRYHPPALSRLAAAGVHARRMTPSFPSKTFPNHYTLVTGLRPEHHGIVSNTFFDPALQATFNKNRAEDNADPKWWTQGEPVWITAERQGVRSACVVWPGDEVENHGHRPSLMRPYERGLSSAQRVDTLLEWLARPAATRPRLGLVYLEVVDNAGHRFGPDAPEMAAAVQEADDAVARLVAGLDHLGLRDATDLVVVSDHGLSPTSTDRVIFLEDLMDVATVQVESTGANGGVRPNPHTVSAAELARTIRAKAPPQLQVYLREEVPARLHYRANDRIPSVVLVADDSWMIESKVGWSKFSARYDRGNHGWDPAAPNMGALFIAQGAAFRHGVTLDDIPNTAVYNLLCATLGVKPAPNDGDDTLVRAVLAR